jgi:excisionase family DNA binding protein
MKAKTKPTALRTEPKLVGATARILPTYLTVRETANTFRVSEASVRLALTQGKLRRYKWGSRTLIKLADAEAQLRVV